MRITKSKFVDYINQIQKLIDGEDELNIVGRKLFDSFEICFGYYVDLGLQILIDVFDDKDNWICYFVYELDFGKKWKQGMVTENDVDVKLQTAEDLYDLLIKNMETDTN